MKAEVHIHSSDNLSFLLLGRKPLVTSRKSRTGKRKNSDEQPSIDMTGFPPEITSFKRKRPKTSITRSVRPMADKITTEHYKKVASDKDNLRRLESDLSTYSDNHKRKVQQIHNDWEEKYMAPFNENMRKQLNGSRYRDFRRTWTQTIKPLESNRPTLNTLIADKPIDNPTISLSTSGCRDKIRNYCQFTKKEEELTHIIDEHNGIVRPKTSFEPRYAFDNPRLERYPETRFYYGTLDESKTFGRRAYTAQFESRAGTAMSNFD